VTIIPTVRRNLFGRASRSSPRTAGPSPAKDGRGIHLDFEEQARRHLAIAPGLAISPARFAELIDTCRRLRSARRPESADRLTIPA